MGTFKLGHLDKHDLDNPPIRFMLSFMGQGPMGKSGKLGKLAIFACWKRISENYKFLSSCLLNFTCKGKKKIEKAVGFTMTDLQKLMELKSNTEEKSLLHYMVEEVENKDAMLLQFVDDLYENLADVSR